MASGKGRVLGLLGALVLSEARVVSAKRVGAFVHLRIHVKAAAFEPGDKIQILLPSKDVRTYTPLGWEEGEDGELYSELLIYLHSVDTPATAWACSIAEGDLLRFVGPQRSLRMPEGALVLIGDETSVAVAAAYTRARAGQVRALFVGDQQVLAPALETAGLDARVFAGPEPLAAALAEMLPAAVGITGGGALIQRVRAQMRARQMKPEKIKAYWIAGRTGID